MLTLRNDQGSTTGKVAVTKAIQQGLIFAPNNFTDLGAMQLVLMVATGLQFRLQKPDSKFNFILC